MRTIIEVPDEVVESLDELGKQQGVSRAALIRDAISDYLTKCDAKRSDAFGLWKDRNQDGVEYQELLREEWK